MAAVEAGDGGGARMRKKPAPSPTRNINRSNLAMNTERVRAALEQGLDDTQELRRLLSEAMQAITLHVDSLKVIRAATRQIITATDDGAYS